MMNVSALGDTSPPSDTNPPPLDQPPPADETDHSNAIDRFKSGTLIGGRYIPLTEFKTPEEKKAEQDAKWWLEPAGYMEAFPDFAFKAGVYDENGRLVMDGNVPRFTNGVDSIRGVLKITSDLVGVLTDHGSAYWVSRLANPTAFWQAEAHRTNIFAKGRDDDPWSRKRINIQPAMPGVPSAFDKAGVVGDSRTEQEEVYRNAGYIPFDRDLASTPIKSGDIVGVFVKPYNDIAAFLMKRENEPMRAFYIFQGDDPVNFDKLVKLRDKRRLET